MERDINKLDHLGHKAEAEFLKRIADNSQDMLYRMSLPEGKYEYVSPAAIDIFGEPPEKWYATSKMITEFIHPESRLYFEQEWANLLAGDMPPTYEYQIITRAGETKWVGQRNVLVNDEIGKE